MLSALFISGAACSRLGNVETVSHSIDNNHVQRLIASLEIDDGQVDVNGGADGLVNTKFTTNDKRIPYTDFKMASSTGNLTVTQAAKSGGFNFGPTTNHWIVNLNDDVPVDLTVTSKSAQANLSLDTLTVDKLHVSSDSGEATVSLNGAQDQLNDVSLRSASGDLHLTLDGDYRAAATINVDSSSGDVTADLNGNWSGNVTGTLKTDSGTIVVTIPKRIGVRINASTDSGFVDASELTDEGAGVYVNAAAASGAVTMRLDIQSSNGNITIREGN